MISATVSQANISLGVKCIYLAVVEGVSQHRVNQKNLELIRKEAHQKALALDESFGSHRLLVGHRELLGKLGYSKRKARPAPERLIHICKKRGFPQILPAVDAYNSVVVEDLVGVGAHDADKIEGPIRFDIAAGGEAFLPLLKDNPIRLRAGDYFYRDSKRILGRLACEDCDETKVTKHTKRILLVSEGNPNSSKEEVRNIVEKSCQRIVDCCGGSYTIWAPVVTSE